MESCCSRAAAGRPAARLTGKSTRKKYRRAA
ncbi:hypothetical protein EYF80_062742 [Liparis tanakae]|uniref:Uncharacterized protein n=1 Tax=Liparis tanakae TaxID=230148 RepID=A0A4Z2EED7_9TELE|nr:hypothetical protein EYF80_062742 [Liparis tanakae]